MENLIEQKPSGLWWPKKDTNYRDCQFEIKNPLLISKHCKNHNVVVQAGGRCGTYPILYSKIFNKVYTFEPEALNFYCLKKNITEDNIVFKNACLGNESKFVDVKLPKKATEKKGINVGTYQVSGEGNIPMILIDSIDLKFCDLIHLDIEGYEGYALEGALNTIKKFQPVICLEVNGLGKQFNYPKNKILDLLNSLNYKYVETIDADMLFVYNG